MNRREFLKLGGLAALGAMLSFPALTGRTLGIVVEKVRPETVLIHMLNGGRCMFTRKDFKYVTKGDVVIIKDGRIEAIK